MKTKDKVISHLLSLIKKLTTALTDKKSQKYPNTNQQITQSKQCRSSASKSKHENVQNQSSYYQIKHYNQHWS